MIKGSIEQFLNLFKSNPLNLLVLFFVVILLTTGALVANSQLQKQQNEQADKKATDSARKSATKSAKTATGSTTFNSNGYIEEYYEGPAVILYVEGMQPRPNRGGQVRIDAGQTTKTVTLKTTAKNLKLSDCSLVREVTADDASFTKQTIQMEVKEVQHVQLIDGEHNFKASCTKGNKTYADDYTVIAVDNQPKLCKGFQFVEGSITPTTLEELKSGFVGTWEGCVSTPWTPSYFVSMTFTSDGSYSAVSSEKMDGLEMNAMYYGTEANHSLKKYYLSSLQSGEIDIVFDPTVTKGDLREIKLMGNKLSFEFFHNKKYGPIKFQLNKK